MAAVPGMVPGRNWTPDPPRRKGGHQAYDGTREGARIANDRVQWKRDHPESPPPDRYGSGKPKTGPLPKTPAPKGKSSKPVGGSVKVPGLTKAPSDKGTIRTNARPDAFGDRTQFEKDRQEWARNHPDNQGKDKVPTYTPPKKSTPSPIPPKPKPKIPSLGPAGRTIPGSSAVHGMIARY